MVFFLVMLPSLVFFAFLVVLPLVALRV